MVGDPRLTSPTQSLPLARPPKSVKPTQREMIEGLSRRVKSPRPRKLILETLAKRVGSVGEAEACGLAGAFDRAKDAVGNFIEGLVEVTGIAGATEVALERIASGIEWVNDALFTEPSAMVRHGMLHA